MPLGTDVFCVRQEDGAYSFVSEWGAVISGADDVMAAIGYIVKLLRISSD